MQRTSNVSTHFPIFASITVRGASVGSLFAVTPSNRARDQVAEGDRCSYSCSFVYVFDYEHEHRSATPH